MGVMVGVVIGYALGTRAGEQGWQEFRSAWKTISTSEEVRDMLTAGLSVSRDLVARGSEMLADRLQSTDVAAALRAA